MSTELSVVYKMVIFLRNGNEGVGLWLAGSAGPACALLLLLTAVFPLGSCALHNQTETGRVRVRLSSTEHNDLSGVWQDHQDPSFFVGIEGSQILIAYSGRVREAARVLRVKKNRLHICNTGHDAYFGIGPHKDEITIEDSIRGKVRTLHKIDSRPDELSLAFPLPDPMPLSEDQVLAIQGEVYRRQEADQALLKTRRRPGGSSPPWLQQSTSEPVPSERELVLWADRTSENTEYIRGLLSEVGWIDVSRFGYGASKAAFLIVQHSWDIPLMLSVLPRIQEDVDAGRLEAEDYALLYDRLHLALGCRQRYGSQVTHESGEVVVLPVEDQNRVEELRKELGLIPLLKYVEVFGATEVRFSTACSPE